MSPTKSSKRPLITTRKSSTLHYQTFTTSPPTSRGKPPPSQNDIDTSDRSHDHNPTSNHRGRSSHTRTSSHPSNHSSHHQNAHDSSPSPSPLPKGQLAVLAIIALAEQTALNSIAPYLPQMVSTFPSSTSSNVGFSVGLIASSFALAQFLTNFFWGYLSDQIGRKPIILFGTISTAVCFVAFGFVGEVWQACLVQALIGLTNGNSGVISTCLGEITDRTNQSKAFTYLPLVYGFGGVTGPLMGGLLAGLEIPWMKALIGDRSGKYLLPNLFSALILVLNAIVTMIWLEESLEQDDLPPIGRRVENIFAWLWQFTGLSYKPSYIRKIKRTEENDDYRRLHGEYIEDDDEVGTEATDGGETDGSTSVEEISTASILTKDTILLLATFFVFNLGNIAFNSLYPIFGQEEPPYGRDLSPKELGLSLGFAGLATIAFQIGIFSRLRDKIGNKATYRAAFAGMILSFILLPLVGYKDGKDGSGSITINGRNTLYAELGVVLIIKTIATVGCLTSALLLITNSAPDHTALGRLNGMAETLSAAGRAIGPSIAGGLFTASTEVSLLQGKFIAFGPFAVILLVGFGLCFTLSGNSQNVYDGFHSDSEDDEGDGNTDDNRSSNELERN